MKLFSPPLHEPKLLSLEESSRRDLLPLRRPRKDAQTLEFHLRVGAPESTSVLIRVDACTQRRAEQFAQAWASRRWFKDQRVTSVYETHLID